MPRRSYWPYKAPLAELEAMERGEAPDKDGARISRFVFAGQQMQNPIAVGGNLIRGADFKYYTVLPRIKYRIVTADTAQKTKERNDYSVFACWGLGEDGWLYLLDLIRGKWEAPELETKCIGFWAKQKAADVTKLGQLRKMWVEDKSSGTGLVQKIKFLNHIPIEGMERDRDKLTRVMDIVGYIPMVAIPIDAEFTNDFVKECEAFTADDSHAHDDQVDVLVDAIMKMLSTQNKLETWKKII